LVACRRHYLPDQDNCIPITDEPYFEDDIVGRFIDFIRIVYGAETLVLPYWWQSKLRKNHKCFFKCCVQELHIKGPDNMPGLVVLSSEIHCELN